MILKINDNPALHLHGDSIWRGSWAVSCLWLSMRRVCTLFGHSWATPQVWAVALPFCQQQVAPMACSALYLRWWAAPALSVLSRVLGKVGPCNALKGLEMVRSGSAEEFKLRLVMRRLLADRAFTCAIPFFLHSSSFSHFLFGSCILGANSDSSLTYEQLWGWCASPSKARLRLEGVSSAVFIQQHTVSMCLNEVRVKRIRGYHIFPETAAFLGLKSSCCNVNADY